MVLVPATTAVLLGGLVGYLLTAIWWWGETNEAMVALSFAAAFLLWTGVVGTLVVRELVAGRST